MSLVRIKQISTREIADLIALGELVGLSPWTAQNYLDELKNPHSILLRLESDNNSSIGFIVGRLVPAVDSDINIDAEIYNIAIDPAERRRGYGDALLAEFISRCSQQGVRYIWLEVRESNSNAINFYQKREFSMISKRRSFYRDPVEDALLMRRTLKHQSAKISLD